MIDPIVSTLVDALRQREILCRLLTDPANKAQIHTNRRGELFLKLDGLLPLSVEDLEALANMGVTPDSLREAKSVSRRKTAGAGIMWTKELDN